MSLVFEKILPLVNKITEKFNLVSYEITEEGIKDYDWYNKIFYSFNKFRRAHIEVLDRREQNNMWIMHTTVFPHLDDDAPIFGFDIICTGNKVSGVFHDLSITTNPNHPLQVNFKKLVSNLTWKRERELPEWGKAIFSEDMIAAGGSNTEQELQQIVDVCLESLDVYLRNIGATNFPSPISSKEMQNRYCKYQKMNPYPVKMLTNFGLTEEQARQFVEKHLFPEV
jgi:hypothetical protein